MNRSAPIFSPIRIWAMALNTLTELTRLKIFYFLLIFALLTIGSSFFTADLKTDEQFQLLKDVSLGSMSIFTSLIAILATALLLPKDLEDRTTFTILAKPVPRYEYLLGKLLGIFLLLALAIVVMTGVFLAVLWLRQQNAILAAQGGLQGDELAHEIASIRAVTFNANLTPGIIIIFVKSALLASLTLMISTFATTSIFTMMMSIAIYFIGHLQATAREYWLDAVGVQWWTKPALAAVALLFPDLQAFSLTDDVVAGVPIHLSLFLQTATLGFFYVVVYYLLSCFFFSNREL
ncbi:MAG TPA: ABC transporter permease subunit [Chthoniobacterales bacterium]|nr:ABC transporter permease subunit [Chthoniobacterales bacterium]